MSKHIPLRYYDDEPTPTNEESIFLAGPSSETLWRPDAIDLLLSKGWTGEIVIPEFASGYFDSRRFDDGKASGVPGLSRSSQKVMDWETRCIDRATVLLIWMPFTPFDDPRKWVGLSTRSEASRAIEQKRFGLALGMPADAFRMGQIRYHAYKAGYSIAASLEYTVINALRLARCARLANYAADAGRRQPK